MRINRLQLGLACLLAVGVAAACTDDEAAGDLPDGAVNGSDGGAPRPGDGEDAGSKDADTDPRSSGDAAADADADADADAAPLPGVVTDLVAVAETHASVKLTWTAPPDNSGTGPVAHYEIRYATTPITTEADFLAATALETPPAAEAPGSVQTTILEKLAGETQHYVALRAQYDDESYGPLSNVATATTKPRATFLISEIAAVSSAANGGDFIELVATKAGFAGGLDVCDGGNDAFLGNVSFRSIHTLGAVEVALGDRIVVHLSGLPGPAGFVQEDGTKSKTSSTAAFASAGAYDVYSASTDLYGLGAIAIVDGDAIQDGVAYSDRTHALPDEVFFRGFWGFIGLQESGHWQFSLTERDQWYAAAEAETLCPVLLETANASGDTPGDCGGTAATMTDGRSLQRTGTVDTNGPADFTVAPQTRGAPH